MSSPFARLCLRVRRRKSTPASASSSTCPSRRFCRIDDIDTKLAASDTRNATADERKRMLERDALAARLLEITAFLDAMRVRFVALARSDQAESSLDDLRAHIEALEEIEAL